ncbi:hypothetical protein DsansV1_C62g0268561 [Dioscorea sansibarensis]
MNNELLSRIKVLEKEKRSLVIDMLEKRTRLYNDENEQKCLHKTYDPLLNGPYRGTIKKLYSKNDLISNRNRTTEDAIETFWINKIHDILYIYNDSRKFEHQKNLLDGESVLNFIGNSLSSISMGKFSFESTHSFNLKKFSCCLY